MKKVPKKVWIILGVTLAAVVAAAVALILVLGGKEETYRSILVYQVSGEATITREGVGEMEAYENLMLQSGDTVTVAADSSLRLKLDDDKYIMVEPESELGITADGNSEDSRTSIDLRRGAITNEIQNKLSEGSSYEVTTPNSIMAVRGTVFRVSVEYDENGDTYTRVSTFEGRVVSRLIKPDGSVVDEEVVIEDGNEVIIRGTAEDTIYLTGPEEIDFASLPTETLEYLREIAENGTKLCITAEELSLLLEEETPAAEEEEPDHYSVTFQYNGATFGTQQVKPGEKATEPKLSPAASGAWDYDFSQEVHEDTVIQWK